MGLNRSVLVAVLAAELLGEDLSAVVARLRAKRSASVLFNETFERYVLGHP